MTACKSQMLCTFFDKPTCNLPTKPAQAAGHQVGTLTADRYRLAHVGLPAAAERYEHLADLFGLRDEPERFRSLRYAE